MCASSDECVPHEGAVVFLLDRIEDTGCVTDIGEGRRELEDSTVEKQSGGFVGESCTESEGVELFQLGHTCACFRQGENISVMVTGGGEWLRWPVRGGGWRWNMKSQWVEQKTRRHWKR